MQCTGVVIRDGWMNDSQEEFRASGRLVYPAPPPVLRFNANSRQHVEQDSGTASWKTTRTKMPPSSLHFSNSTTRSPLKHTSSLSSTYLHRARINIYIQTRVMHKHCGGSAGMCSVHRGMREKRAWPHLSLQYDALWQWQYSLSLHNLNANHISVDIHCEIGPDGIFYCLSRSEWYVNKHGMLHSHTGASQDIILAEVHSKWMKLALGAFVKLVSLMGFYAI